MAQSNRHGHGRSPSVGNQQIHINRSQSSSRSPFTPGDQQSVGIGLGLQPSTQQPFAETSNNAFDSFNPNDFLDVQTTGRDPNSGFDPSTSFGQQPRATGSDPSLAFDPQSQQSYLSPNINDGDFSLFPPQSDQGEHFNSPLFEQATLNPNEINNMTSPHSHHSPTPPQLLQPESHMPGSAHQSPSSFNQHQFSSPPAGHSRHVSLGPEAALLPNQINEWSQPQFQGHRRSPSEYSDVSSVSPSPLLVSSDNFDADISGHSPLQRPSDGSLYQDVLGIGTFSLSDNHSPGHQGRSPSHSPAISPRIHPQQLPDRLQPGFGLAALNSGYGGAPGYSAMQTNHEAFPSLQGGGALDMPQMAPPAINIDFAPNNSKPGIFEPSKPRMDQDSLTPPERGMCSTLFTVVYVELC